MDPLSGLKALLNKAGATTIFALSSEGFEQIQKTKVFNPKSIEPFFVYLEGKGAAGGLGCSHFK